MAECPGAGSARRLRVMRALVVAGLAAGPGCIVINPGHAPGPVLRLREPDTRRDYLLYVPSTYTPDQAWPLVIACHGSRLLDSPRLQIDEWKALAESKGFLVIAPELEGASLPADPGQALARLRRDEGAILAILAHVRAARNIDTNLVFLAGWQAGAYPALYTGLKNPNVFRAIGLRQPGFDARLVEPCLPYVDHQQPVLIVYGVADLDRSQSQAAAEWFRRNRMAVNEQEVSGAGRRDPTPIYAFLRDTVRAQPWIRLAVAEVDPSRPLTVAFSVESSIPLDLYQWDFGDGGSSKVAQPEHTYAKAGTYRVRVTVTSGKKSYARQIEIRLPRTRLGATQPAE